MARGLMTALQAALAGVSGGAAGYARYQEQERQRLREEEERKRREAMDLITFGERAVEPGPLATRAPAGGAGQIAGRTAGAAPPPPSAISLPTGPMDFGEAEQQLAQEQARPSGTTPLEIGGQTLYIPIGQRARDIKRSEQARASADALADALARAEAVGGVERRQAQETAIEKERVAFNALKKYKQVTGDFDPTYGQYGEDLQDYRQIRVSRATQRTGGGGGDTMATFIDKQVADEITRMSREGYEVPNPAYGLGRGQSPTAPKTIRVRYKPEELRELASQIRSGLRTAFEIDNAPARETAGRATGAATAPAAAPAAGRGAPARTDTVPTSRQMRDLLTSAALLPAPADLAKPSITAGEYRQLRAKYSDEEIRGRYTVADESASAPKASALPSPEEMIAASQNPRAVAESRRALEARGRPLDIPESAVAAEPRRTRQDAAPEARAAAQSLVSSLLSQDDTLPLFDRSGRFVPLPMPGPSPSNPLGGLPFAGAELLKDRPLREEGAGPMSPRRREQIRADLERRLGVLDAAIQRSGPSDPRQKSMIQERETLLKTLQQYFGEF